MPRARIVRQCGDSVAFEPFGRWAFEEMRVEIARSTPGRICAGARGEPDRAARMEPAAKGSGALRPPSRTGSGNVIGAAGHLGSARLGPSAPDLADHGAPPSRSGGSMERVSGGVAVPGARGLTKRSGARFTDSAPRRPGAQSPPEIPATLRHPWKHA